MLSAEESLLQFCEIDEDLDCSSAPSWLFSSSYWSESLNDDHIEELFEVTNDDGMPLFSAIYDEKLGGVRLVIVVSKSIFSN